MDRLQTRRNDALATRVAMRRMGSIRTNVHDPAFNVREIVKQMILLEDHLIHKNKICSDCIRKHLMTIEALAEEATCLDTGRIFGKSLDAIAAQARSWMVGFLDGSDCVTMSQEIRSLRKSICPLFADPRGMAQRTAARYEQRNNPCNHG